MAEPVLGNFSVRTRTFLLLPVRVFVGALFLLLVIEQLKAGWLGADAMQHHWQPLVDKMQWTALQGLLNKYVLAHSAAAGAILMFVKAVIGVLLIIGLGVRPASLVGMVLVGVQVLVFGYSKVVVAGRPPEGEVKPIIREALELHTQQFGLYGLIFLVLLVFFLTGAGRSFGLDGLMWRRRTRRLARAAESAASSEEPTGL